MRKRGPSPKPKQTPAALASMTNRKYSSHITRLVNNTDADVVSSSIALLSGNEPMFDPIFQSNPLIVRNNNCYAHAAGLLKTSTKHDERTKMQPGNRSMKYRGAHAIECAGLKNLIGSDWAVDDMQFIKHNTKSRAGHFRVMILHTKLKSKAPRGYDTNWDYHFYVQVLNPFNVYFERMYNRNAPLIHMHRQPHLKHAYLTLNGKDWVAQRKVRYLKHLKDTVGDRAFMAMVLRYGSIPDGVWSHKRGTAYEAGIMDANQHIIFDPRLADANYGRLNYQTVCNYVMLFKNKSQV